MYKFRLLGRVLTSGMAAWFFLIASFFTLWFAVMHFNVMVLLGFLVAIIWTKLGLGKKKTRR